MEYDMNKDLLPVGTIVKIRLSKQEYMIMGFYIKNPDSDKVYDYSAVIYPEGLMSLDDVVVFDRDYIKKVVHLGYVDDEEIKFKKEINELAEAAKQGKSHTSNVHPVETIDL